MSERAAIPCTEGTGMHILIGGASGLIGTALRRRLDVGAHEVRTLVRRASTHPGEYFWEPERERVPADAIEWADAVVNLGGAPLARFPWTEARRRSILASRVHATRTLATAIRAAEHAPSVLLSGSAVGLYGNRPGERLDESATPGRGFLAHVVQRWEAAANPAVGVTRVVFARTGLVLADGGALAPIILAARLGAGTHLGDGRQHWPWIALGDEVAAIEHLVVASDVAGPVNLAGPEPATADAVTDAVSHALGKRSPVLRVPAWALRLGLGAAADDLLLADQLVVPAALEREGFAFAHPTLDAAVRAALDVHG